MNLLKNSLFRVYYYKENVIQFTLTGSHKCKLVCDRREARA